MSDLRKAAQALVDRWDTPLWKDAPHTGVFIDALRAALAQPERKPLTDQEIIEAIKHISHNEMSAFAIARAIEKFRFGT